MGEEVMPRSSPGQDAQTPAAPATEVPAETVGLPSPTAADASPSPMTATVSPEPFPTAVTTSTVATPASFHGITDVLPRLVFPLSLLAAALVGFALGRLLFRRRTAKPESVKCGSTGAEPVKRVSIGKLHAQGKRAYQQDNFGVSDTTLFSTCGVLAVVADGMGGLADGDKVSSTAVRAALDMFMLSYDCGTPEQVLLTILQRCELSVNSLLGVENYRKSGTTFLLGLLRDGAFHFLSIGDSHIYLLRNGMLTLLNREHIYQNELALKAVNGDMPLPAVYTNEDRNGLVSYLGMGRLQYMDLPAEPIAAQAGDRFVLMSDGVYNALTQRELLDALSGPPQEAAERLGMLIESKQYADQDNYTAVILACE